MRFRYIFGTALSVVAASASAQSSVTLYGVVDVNMRYVKNSDLPSNTTMATGGLSSGRLGFRGIEDLGGGLKAGLVLEGDVTAHTGTTSPNDRLFSRRSTVSLLGSLGELRLGRDLSPASAHSYVYDPFGVVGLGGSNVTSRIGRVLNTYYRSDNSVQYMTPNFGGFHADFMYALDERVGDNAGRHAAARLKYDKGPIGASLSYGTTRLPGATATTPRLQTGDDYTSLGVGLSYDFGFAKLYGHFFRDELPLGIYTVGSTTTLAGSENRWLLGVTVPVGVHYIRASYVALDSRDGTAEYNEADASKFAIGYVHNLSKRTALYGTAAYVNNKGRAAFSLPGATPGLAEGGNSTGFETGIRHLF